MKKLLTVVGIVVAVILVGIGYLLYPQLNEVINYGSVGVSDEYNATTTPENLNWTDRQIDVGQGALGQVVITTAGTIVFDLLNATTTNVNARTGNKATSTILIASFPASAAVGTYVFDAVYTDGLYLDIKGGSLGTSTILYR